MKRILSCGGGLDSFAMLLLAIKTGELPDHVVFADVGSGTQEIECLDGEWPSTYRHLREVFIPLCQEHDIPFDWLNTGDYPIRHGESLLAYYESKRAMPVRARRSCTSMSKVERIADWLEDYYPGENIEFWIGFEAGEEGRVHHDPHAADDVANEEGRVNRYPLIEHGLCRCGCEDLARASGLPVPRKSACMFCPFASKGDFQTLARELPEVFERVVRLEDNCRQSSSGKTIRYTGGKKDERTGEYIIGPRLEDWVQRPYMRRLKTCEVCGRTPRASKATGCTYLRE